MYNPVMINRVKDKLNKIDVDDKTLIVLKGIPLSMVDPSMERISLDRVIDDRIGYFISTLRKRNYASYEEFILLADFMILQYKKIYVLNNNIYMEQYPIEEYFTNEVRKGLLTHFNDLVVDENDDTIIGDIEDYVAIFDGLKEHNGFLIGAYSEPSVLSNNKVINVDIFDIKKEEPTIISDNIIVKYDLIEEFDYINLVKRIFDAPDKIYIKIDNFIGNRNRLKDHIAMISYYWKDYTDIFYIQIQTGEDKYECKPEYGAILKKYWGYGSYRKFPVYDMRGLERNEKKVIQVSQEKIISNIVQQVENCGNDKDFRDLFITAPTGSGKSVMFQVPAIYLAEKYDLLTIVISPLIGLMNDQVKNLELKNYDHAKTINSDISLIVKQDIINRISDSQYHILYISPETLLSRNDIEQLIGKRTIGMIVIDEAHIVTTWGKQFRPDYWYLGDHIRKLRKKQIDTKQRSFVIAAFTATAIYHGPEDMYTEIINSLHMLDPITYLGYVKRKDIDIVVDRTKKAKSERSEYELDKFEYIEDILKRAMITNKKTLIYFPTVALIERCFEYLRSKRKIENVAVYYGTLNKNKKQENYAAFCEKKKLVMLATKAFGMGIDIDDIELIVHVAPTGNVCDYVQEIGRAARREDLRGEARYCYDPKDFKHINRLHGLSAIRHYQLIKVIEKIDELYKQSIQNDKKNDFTKRRNAMLLDAENFSYIFGSPISDEDNNINKVKTALLLIQKDFESKKGFSPINVRPIPTFSIGFFEISSKIQERLSKKYPKAVEEIDEQRHICRVRLSVIWERDYKILSFPKFKFMLYSKDQELDLVRKYPMSPILRVNVIFDNEYPNIFKNTWDTIKKFIRNKVRSSEYISISEMMKILEKNCKISKYKAQTICEVVIASMDPYRKNFARTSAPIVLERTTTGGKTKYQFNVAVNSYFGWVENGLRKIESETRDGKLYLINDNKNYIKEYGVLLGIFEAIGCLMFEMIGGANTQLYIYINQIQALKNILNAPSRYKNRLLDIITEKHIISVKMLTYLYEGKFSNEEMWGILEDYFLGKIPEKVQMDCEKECPDMIFDQYYETIKVGR